MLRVVSLYGLVGIGLLAHLNQISADDNKPSDQFAQLAAEYDRIEQTFINELKDDRSREGVSAANRRNRESLQAWWEKSITLIRQHPAEAAALPVIEKYLERNGVDNAELADIVHKHHMADPRVIRLVQSFYQSNEKPSWTFALEIADRHRDKTIRGQASLIVGEAAKWELVQDEMPTSSKKRPLAEEKRAVLRSHVETYLTQAAKDYAETPAFGGGDTIGFRSQAGLAGLANLANLRVGKVAPEIEGKDLDGNKLKLSDARGKAILLVFWASWCGPCMADVPHELELAERMKDRAFVLIGVNGDEDLEKAHAAVKRAKISWRSFASVTGRAGQIPAAWNVYSWPTTYVLDHEGVIRHWNLRGKDLDKPLDDLMTAAEKGSRK